jgi:maltooligosyltrehalose trehalohydrolase
MAVKTIMHTAENTLRLGANLRVGACEFRVWAPNADKVMLGLGDSTIPMHTENDGYFSAHAAAVAGDRYSYVVDGSKPLPDPVSRYLPEGVHGRTEIVDTQFDWTDQAWRGIPLEDYIVYELHVGTFTPAGIFDGVLAKLDYLKNTLGMSAIELMPVAAFPGERNWGYDGVSPFAVQASYGGPEALKRLVNAAHEIGLAVILDVVYNHFGNEGNYLGNFGPYLTGKHKTPWGDAINYDQAGCEGVREFVMQNALYWIREYHMDGLRLDAVQTIHDDSPLHIIAELQEKVQQLAMELGRTVCVIAESDENDSKLVLPRKQSGYALDAFWSDDFHHALHALFTGEDKGYYQDFGSPEQLVTALNDGFVFQGQRFEYWKRPRGTSAKDVPLPANVICIQNHDQVGNRAFGERATELFSPAQRRAAAALLLLAPHTPLLFMGQEYDEVSPFLFFTSYGDEALRHAVRKGRRDEFKDFAGFQHQVPDPESEATFLNSKLNWHLTRDNEMLTWYRELIRLRKAHVIGHDRRCHAQLHAGAIFVEVPAPDATIKVVASLTERAALPEPQDGWLRVLEAADEKCSVHVYVR